MKDTSDLDIVMPVYEEGDGITAVVNSLAEHVKTSCRLLICYDRDSDSTLATLKDINDLNIPIIYVKNEGHGVWGAIKTGFLHSTAPCVLMMPADDDYNAPVIDNMVTQMLDGAEIVAPGRFMLGGCMVGCRWHKAILVRCVAFFMVHVVRISVCDATNGFRMFSRRVLDEIEIESTKGFTYSIELLVKCHRLGWKIKQVPVQWHERKTGSSRFKVFAWASSYLRWVFYGMATTYLGRRKI